MILTTMSNHSQRNMTPSVSRKRKEVEGGFDALKASTTPTITTPTTNKTVTDNRLLAGYLAHEFLAQGTLFGQRWDPAGAEAAPKSATSNKGKGRAEPKEEVQPAKHQSYAEVANLFKTEGTHIEGIVNPTQLARWIQM